MFVHKNAKGLFFVEISFHKCFLMYIKEMKEVGGKYTATVGEQHGREDPFVMPT